QGADGIKILKVDERLLPKYLYFILKVNPIKSDGYRRHFSKLKETKIPLPPLEVQHEIVARIEAERKVVDGCKELIALYEAKIKQVIDKVWEE
ncbi:MAG TPA: restriction endonuclease subunit S, partial [Thermodesulfobacteriota bacterium]|nr:restriction endonuclease subunit S [Thermodesulfobacteriota bacterium]